MTSIRDHRAFFARIITGSVGASDEGLVRAFATTERERYLGKGPWLVAAGDYVQTPTDDPIVLYQDIVVAIAAERGINNGQPSLHAQCLAACRVAEAETIVHVGAGTGYYTSILAKLVGSQGRVVAFETEADLAGRARDLLREHCNVDVICASGCKTSLPAADVIYVSAGATHPPDAWLDALRVGGRLVFPLTPANGFGGILLIRREAATRYSASMLTQAGFIHCMGARDEACEASLALAFESKSLRSVKSLRRNTVPDHTVWCAGTGWWLSTSEDI